MKRLLALLLVLVWMVPCAVAEETPHGLQLEINGMWLSSEWMNEKSDTHDWLSVDVTVTNWNMEAVPLSEKIAADLTYMEQYSFDGELVFAADTIEPLVQLDGTLLYRIPKMVSQSLEKAEITITVDGNATNPEIVIGSTQISRSIDRFECDGFASPEDAVKAYIEAFNNGDVSGMLSTFAIETYVDHIDRQAMIERMGEFSIYDIDTYPVPADYPRNLLVARRWGDLAESLSEQCLIYSWPREEYDYPSISLKFEGEDSSAEISAFLNAFNDAEPNFWTGNIEFVEFIDVTQLECYELLGSEQLQKHINNRLKYYRYDEIDEPIAHIRINGEDYLQFMQCARYGERWYNYKFGGTISSLMNLSYQCAGLAPEVILDDY